MLKEIMSLSTDEIKERFNLTKAMDISNTDLLDKLWYCYFIKSGNEPTNKERFERLDKQFRIDVYDDGKYDGIDYTFMKQQKELRKPQHYEFDKDRNYVNISSGVLNMPRIKKSLRNPTSLLIYLLQWKGHAKHNGLAGKWYKKGFIVASQAMEQIAHEFQVSEKTIERWVNALEQDGLLLVEKSGLYNVYVLGIVNKKTGIEKYYYCGDTVPYRKPDRNGKK